MKNFFNSRIIQAALIGLIGVVLLILFTKPTTITVVSGSGNLPTGISKVDPILIKLTYQPPRIAPDDQCDETCIGVYTKIGEDGDFLYFDHPACTSSQIIGYHYDSGNAGEKLISDWQVKETRTCDWIGIPKRFVLKMIKSSNSTSTIKTVPNYKVIDDR